MNNRFAYIIVVALMIASCKDKDQQYSDSLLGTWDVYASEMNNKPNDFMKEGWFVFNGDNSVHSNLFDGNKKHTYIVDNGRLVIDSDEKLDMKISRLEKDSLHLEGQLKMYYMEYFLTRRK